MSNPPAELPHASWSQIETFDTCERKWKYRWVRPDIVEPPSETLEIGTEAHAVLEHYYDPTLPAPVLKFAEHIVHKSIEKLKLDPKMPPLGHPDIRVEFPKNYQLGIKAAGVSLKGRIDLLLPTTKSHLVIYDWKTSSNLNYAKPAEELERFGQPITYGEWAFRKFPHLQTVEFAHGNISTTNVEGFVVKTSPLSREHVADQFSILEGTVQRMAGAFQVVDPLDVKPSPKQCMKFRRPCMYAGICPDASPAAREALANTQWMNNETKKEGAPVSTENLREKLAARKVATSIQPPDAPKPEKPASQSQTQTPTPGPTTMTGLVLLIDGLPQKGFGSVTYLEDLIAERSKAVLEKWNLKMKPSVPFVDVREVEFGNGTNDLIAAFKRNPPTGVVSASMHDRLSAEIVAVLTPLATQIFRAR